MKLPLKIEPDQPSHGQVLCLVDASGGVVARTPEVPYYGHRQQKQDETNLAFIAERCNYTGPSLWLDQYGQPVWAHTVKELKEKVGPGRVFKIYTDKKSGGTVHTGYGVGRRWFTRYIPWEKQV